MPKEKNDTLDELDSIIYCDLPIAKDIARDISKRLEEENITGLVYIEEILTKKLTQIQEYRKIINHSFKN
jgi:hypothetical protein